MFFVGAERGGFNQRDVDLPVGRKKKGRDAMVEMARVAMMDR